MKSAKFYQEKKYIFDTNPQSFFLNQTPNFFGPPSPLTKIEEISPPHFCVFIPLNPPLFFFGGGAKKITASY